MIDKRLEVDWTTIYDAMDRIIDEVQVLVDETAEELSKYKEIFGDK